MRVIFKLVLLLLFLVNKKELILLCFKYLLGCNIVIGIVVFVVVLFWLLFLVVVVLIVILKLLWFGVLICKLL